MYEKTKAALEALRRGAAIYGKQRDEINYLATKLAEAYAEEVGIPFLEAWRMRDQIAELVETPERR